MYSVNQKSVTSDFWSNFVDKYWEKKAILLAQENSHILPKINPHELFQAVVSCTNSFRHGGQQKVRLFVNDSQVDLLRGGHRELLPQISDDSFVGYHQRMISNYGIEDYALIVADWHQFDRALWEKIVVSLEGLTKLVGISASRMDTQLFLGNYKITPFGVHVDAASAFHFPIVGKKIVRFWPDSYAKQNLALHHARDYARFLENSSVIKAVPGQAIYWPSNYWHIGEGDGTFSVTWRFAYWIAEGLHKLAIAKVAEVFAKLNPSSDTHLPEILTNSDAELPQVEEIINRLLQTVSSDQFRQSLVQSWLERYSAYGFLRVPAVTGKNSIDFQGSIYKKPTFPILATRIASDSICVAAAGRSCILKFSPDICLIIDELNQGKILLLQELLQSRADHNKTIVEFIEFCLQSGVLILEK